MSKGSGKGFRTKKSLGQHFLRSEGVAGDIAGLLQMKGFSDALEIGPGQGILTRALLQRPEIALSVCEFDRRLIPVLETSFDKLPIIEGDFLKLDLAQLFEGQFAIVGNFPYQISTQIVMRVVENYQQIPEMVGMFQREVAQRIVAPPGGRDYGVISVFAQARYETTYCFELGPEAFDPPPRVHSAVIRLQRRERDPIADFGLFKTVVKTAFSQRRKKLRNALKSILPKEWLEEEQFLLRAESLDYLAYERLANRLADLKK